MLQFHCWKDGSSDNHVLGVKLLCACGPLVGKGILAQSMCVSVLQEMVQGMNIYISRKEQPLRMDKRHSQGTLPEPALTPVTKTFLRKAQSCSLLETEITSEDMFWEYAH